MKENKLVDLSRQFAVEIINFCTDLKEQKKEQCFNKSIVKKRNKHRSKHT